MMVKLVNTFRAFTGVSLRELICDLNNFVEFRQKTMRSLTFNFSTTYRNEAIEYSVILLYQEIHEDAQEVTS